MFGSAVSCSVELPVDMNEMLAEPTNISASSSTGEARGERRERHRHAETGGRDDERPDSDLPACGHQQAAEHGAETHRARS